MFNIGDCEFCDEFSGGLQNSFAARYFNELRDRTIFETHHVKVIPSLGHFVKGYLLLVPKPHCSTLAEATREIVQEVEEIKHTFIMNLSALYGPYVFFEHGSRNPLSGGCGIYHAHLHAVPLSAHDLVPTLQEEFANTRIGSLFELQAYASGSSYLYYEDSKSRSWLFFPQFLPSQFMRRLIAEAAGISEWDWRQCGREDALLATRSEVLTALSIAHDSK